MDRDPLLEDAKQTAAAGEGEVWIARRDHELRARFEHLRRLNSAWAVLASFGLSDEARHIVETGRAVAAELARLASQPIELRDRAALPKLDKLLDATESEMHAFALEVPVALLRAALPERLPSERRGVLDLLDLLLANDPEEDDGWAGRISAIDYLITLLCTGSADGDGDFSEDPVGLTPRLHDLCERAGGDYDPLVAEIEVEFCTAAQVSEADAHDESQLRALRRRKRELGARYFEPRVLRAVVAYNAALSRCLARGVWDSRDWGSLTSGTEPSSEGASVFETEALPRLAEALRRRAKGSGPGSGAVDRVAWSLDLPSLDQSARAALLGPTVGQRGNLEGTAILVGLLCHSAHVLEGEFPAIGISPERLSAEWVPDLDDALKEAVNERIAGGGYEEACTLSELRNTFLHSLISEVDRERHRPARGADPLTFERVERGARLLVGEAAEQAAAKADRAARDGWKSWRSWPWVGIARLAGAGAVVGILALALAQVLFDGDVDRLSGAELERVSPYLLQGERNGQGRGPAFVGTIDDAWEQLASDEREQAAMELVEALRAQGVREIMVYDAERGLRIQALGKRSVRVLSSPSS